MNIKKVSMSIICCESDVDRIVKEFYNSRVAQSGIACWGTDITDIDEDDLVEEIEYMAGIPVEKFCGG